MSDNILGPKVLQRVEGGVLLALSLLLYGKSGGEWWLFALLLLAPDLSAFGYLAGSSIGAASYNLFPGRQPTDDGRHSDACCVNPP